MSRIVISYRRKDTAAISGRIFDHLVKELGKKSIFMDIDSIPPGVDYQNHIDNILAKADILLVIIGDRWLGGSENNRILYELDPVRIELESAYKQKINIWPILIDDAQMPLPEQLPSNLRNFKYLNAIYVNSGRDFHSHMDRLVRDISAALAKKRVNFWLHGKVFWQSIFAVTTLFLLISWAWTLFIKQPPSNRDFQFGTIPESTARGMAFISEGLDALTTGKIKFENETKSVPCTQESTTHAPSNSTNKIKLILKNSEKSSKKLYWLDQSGDRRFYSDLDPGAMHFASTFVGRPLVVASGSGSCEKILIPDSDSAVALE